LLGRRTESYKRKRVREGRRRKREKRRLIQKAKSENCWREAGEERGKDTECPEKEKESKKRKL